MRGEKGVKRILDSPTQCGVYNDKPKTIAKENDNFLEETNSGRAVV